MAGKIYMIPVTLGSDDFRSVIPEKVLEITRGLRYFVVENIRSSRRYLRLIDKEFPIAETVFFELNEHTDSSVLFSYIEPVLKGKNLGIMSEAGLPGLADPGAKIVAMAHKKYIKVIPLAGPSSIILSLIASGLNGQKFTFNGYLPVKPIARDAKIREIESRSREGTAQIFMETPYRCQKLLEAILKICNNNTMLCIATDITKESETIITKTISEWKKSVPDINNRLSVFIIQ